VSRKIFEEFPHVKKRYLGDISGLKVIFVSLQVNLIKIKLKSTWHIILKKTPMINLILNKPTGVAGIAGLSVRESKPTYFLQ
jgi:hypothetical protein